VMCQHLNDCNDGDGHDKILILTGIETGMEIYFAGSGGDGERT